MKLTGRTRKVLAFVLLVAMTISSVQLSFAGSTGRSDGGQTDKGVSQEKSVASKTQSVDESKHSLDEPHYAVVAMNNEDGLIFEPHNVWVQNEETLQRALETSGHKFESLEAELKKIDDKIGNYVRYYDGEKYDYEALGKNVGALVFTERLDEDIRTKEYQSLVALLADHKSKPEEERQFDDVKAAYSNALRELPGANKEKAVELATELKAAYQKYKDWDSQEKAQVSFVVSKNGANIANAKVSIVNKFGTEFKGTSVAPIALNSGNYTFVVSYEQNEVSGSFEVKAAEKKTINAPLMGDSVIGSMKFSSAGESKTNLDITASGQNASLRVFDADSDLYANISLKSGISPREYKLYGDYKGVYDGKNYGDESDSKNIIPWGSTNKKLKNVISYGTSTDGFRLKVVHKLDSGLTQRQYYKIDTERIPTLSKLKVTDKRGVKMALDFDPQTQSYTFETTDDTLNFDIDTDRTIESESFGSPDDGYLITIDDQIVYAGSYQVDVTAGHTIITVTNMYTYEENSYRVEFKKVSEFTVRIKKEKGVDVKLINSAGSVIKADETKDTEAIFHVAAGDYEWVSTLDKDYHAKGAIKVEAGKQNTFEAKSPIKKALISSLSAVKTRDADGSSYNEADGKSFDWKNHSYKYVVPDYSALVNIKVERASSDVSITRNEYTTFDGTDRVAKKWAKDESSEVIYRFIGVGGRNNSLKLTAAKTSGDVTYYQDYKLSTVRSVSLNSLGLSDNFGKNIELRADDKAGFSDTTYEYQASVASDVKTVDLILTFPGDNGSEEFVGKYIAKIRGKEYVRPVDGKAVKASIELDDSKTEERIDIEVKNSVTGSISNKYTVILKKSLSKLVRFDVNPSDSRVNVLDEKSGNYVMPEADDSFKLSKGSSYKYTVTHAGYLSKTKTFEQGNETTISVKLEKAPENTKINKDLKAEWPYFRYDANNNGVLDYPLPRNASETTLYWATKFGTADMNGSLGCPIMVDGYIYNYSGTTLIKFDSMTGEVVKTGTMKRKSAFAINAPTYAEGMIFVGLEHGMIQAFDAETLESLWTYQAPLEGQPNCPIAYKDGYIYTGFWNDEAKKANYICLSVTDEDPTKPDEVKEASWVYEGNGFYWAGAYVGNGNAGEIEIASKQARTYIVVGSDDGTVGEKSYGELLSLDPVNGRVIDSIKDKFVGDIRSTIMFDKETARYYFVTKGGYFCSVKLKEDGSFDKDSIKTLSLLPKDYQKYLRGSQKKYIPMSASTPVIYNGRAYIGVGGSGNFYDYSGHNISVIDLKSNTIAYSIETMGYPQASSLLTKAYEKDDQSVYVYFFENKTPGRMRVIKDKPGQTEPTEVEIEYDDKGKPHKVAPVLFTPVGPHAQYVICSPIADEYGNIYFKNDSSHMFMIGPTIKELIVTKKPDKMEYTEGETFDPAGIKVEAVYSNGKVRDVTKYIDYKKEGLSFEDENFAIKLKTGSRMYQNKDGNIGITYEPPMAIIELTIN